MPPEGCRIRAKSYADIQTFVESLGEPQSGTRRVFRGQTRQYWGPTGEVTITPALRRARAADYDAAWLTRMTSLLRMADPSATDGVPFAFNAVWAPALIQQYGPGSHFVDVTFDLATALWFARHTFHQRWLGMAVDVANHGLSDTWNLTAWYTPREPNPGHPAVLYVIDLPEWNGLVVPTEPSIVDLSRSPAGEWLALHAKRIGAQHGGLVHARWLPDGDIGPLLRAWIELDDAFDVEGVAGADRPAAALFPPPAADPFYQLLLHLPQQLHFQPTRLQHALDLPWYLTDEPNVWQADNVSMVAGTGSATPMLVAVDGLDDGVPWSRDLNGFLQRCFFLMPALLHADLALEAPMAAVGDEEHAITNALPILMRSTLFLSTADADGSPDGDWIESGLPLGIAESLQGRSTSSVYVEFAPIDFVAPLGSWWTSTPRAAWLIRRHPSYWLRLYRQNDDGVHSQAYSIRYEATTGRFDADSGDGFDPVARKTLFAVLSLLRDLSPGLKPPPLCGFTIEVKGGMKRLPGGFIRGQRGTLVRVGRGRYFSPKTLAGTEYSLNVDTDRDETPTDTTDARDALGRFFFEMTSPSYAAMTGVKLAWLHIHAESWPDVLAVTGAALALLVEHPVYDEQRVQLLDARAQALARSGRPEAALRCIDDLLAMEPSLDTPSDWTRESLETARHLRSLLLPRGEW